MNFKSLREDLEQDILFIHSIFTVYEDLNINAELNLNLYERAKKERERDLIRYLSIGSN